MSIQSEFINFSNRISIDESIKSELAEKRDVLVRKIRNTTDLPSFDTYNQGSYSMHLSVEPVEKNSGTKEYDIDIALIFHANKDDNSPMFYKNAIYEALKTHTDTGAEIKKPCVTVTYKKNGETAYHADIVSYVYENKSDKNSQLYLARGKKEDDDETFWEKSDPIGLVNYVNNTIALEEERNQYRRVVKYLKRWKNLIFSDVGNVEPPSIGLTLLALEGFSYKEENDLDALIAVMETIKSKFLLHSYDDTKDKYMYSIVCSLPGCLNVENDTNIFRKMTLNYMTDFKEKVDKLLDDLNAVNDEVDEYEKYVKLNKIFGDDFKIPEKFVTAKMPQHSYIPYSSASGDDSVE